MKSPSLFRGFPWFGDSVRWRSIEIFGASAGARLPCVFCGFCARAINEDARIPNERNNARKVIMGRESDRLCMRRTGREEIAVSFRPRADENLGRFGSSQFPECIDLMRHFQAILEMVLGAGLEPARLSPYAPQTYVSANSTTRAFSWGGVDSNSAKSRKSSLPFYRNFLRESRDGPSRARACVGGFQSATCMNTFWGWSRIPPAFRDGRHIIWEPLCR